MRRRPTAVYRVLDEDDLLFGSDYLDAGADRAEDDGRADPAAADPGDPGDSGNPANPGYPGDPADLGDPGDPADLGDLGDPGDPGDLGDPGDPGDGRWPGDGPPGRRQVLIACAGALVLAVLVARLASVLLAGAGAPRGGRSPSGRRSGSPPVAARGLVAVPSPNGAAPPVDRLAVVPGVTPTTFRPVGSAPPRASDRRARSAPTGLAFGPARPREQGGPTPLKTQDRSGRTAPPPAVRVVPSPAPDRQAPSPAQGRPVRPAPFPAPGRPVRPAPPPAQDRALAGAPFAPEQEFGFER
jgi:hypothetical protein